MTDRLTIALAQLDPTVGDIAGNLAKLAQGAATRRPRLGADLVVSPELFVAGYPPEDLVLKPAFVAACEAAVQATSRARPGPGPAVLSSARPGGRTASSTTPRRCSTAARSRRCASSTTCRITACSTRSASSRRPGARPGGRSGACGSASWSARTCGRSTPAEGLAESGAEMLIVINGSPFERDKRDERLDARGRAGQGDRPAAALRQPGRRPGRAGVRRRLVRARRRRRAARAGAGLARGAGADAMAARSGRVWTVDEGAMVPPTRRSRLDLSGDGAGPRATMCARTTFPAWCSACRAASIPRSRAAVAVDALGADKVHCVMMPSPYTSRDSLEDAAAVAKLLGIELREHRHRAGDGRLRRMLAPSFAGRAPDITEENLQSRARGVTLMALSNKFGWMVLSTGNKSEMSVGLRDALWRHVRRLCGAEGRLQDDGVRAVALAQRAPARRAARARRAAVMPERVITKPPTAELKPNQTDQDTLPPYDKLDDILECLIEHEMTVERDRRARP